MRPSRRSTFACASASTRARSNGSVRRSAASPPTSAPGSPAWPVRVKILVSSVVKDLVAGSGIAFEDRGERSLKGVPGEWRIYAVL